jgi:ADP-heptose:LPS heptosyltransferase
MKNNWAHCKNILCIRPDNLGDLLMSGPAIRALKESLWLPHYRTHFLYGVRDCHLNAGD